MQLPELPSGIYRHWKGKLYQVLGYAHDSNLDERVVVVYVPLELDGAHLGPRMAVRSVEDWRAHVHPWDGTVCEGGGSWCVTSRHDDPSVVRFKYLGPELTGDTLVTDHSGTSDLNVPM
jgi:hypothetical protein